MLDTAAVPVHDPSRPKDWWKARSVWLGVVLTILGAATYFGDPIHTPQMTLASLSEAVGGIFAIVLRVWFTAGPIAGTPVAEQTQVAREAVIMHAVATGYDAGPAHLVH